ncbi:C-type lectin domain family 10 member A-like [Tubulanus polymorphus]|uniref:C-type lectin domain family 10 member A-like n=1 Tax=Tubulanus polymorphus TaxID=672921 RepID=UPI003DA52008
MKLIISTLLLVCLTTTVSGCVCDEGWAQAGDTKCFKFFEESLPQDQHCGSSELARIDSMEENNVARNQIPTGVTTAWLGFRRPFNFTTGFTRWRIGEPNGFGGKYGYENCVEMKRRRGVWNDVVCNKQMPAICSKDCQQQ